MARKKILFTSLLKPVTEPRMYLKLALSVAQTSKYAINIIGFKSKNLPPSAGITFIPLFDFNRLSWRRFTAPIKFTIYLLKVNPDLIVVSSIDFQIVTITYKLLFGSKICYDVQENHSRNIRYGNSLPAAIRHLSAWLVRLKERIFIPFADLIVVAEKCYPDQMPYLKNRPILVLENKYRGTLAEEYFPIKEIKTLHLVYTGTLHPSRGIKEAILFTVRLQKHRACRLTIAGFSAIEGFREQLEDMVAPFPFIELIQEAFPLPYEEIVRHIVAADVVLLPLKPDKSTENKVPTKLYEALALKKPILLQQNPPLERICSRYNAAIAIDFATAPAEKVSEALNTTGFYTKMPGKEVLWAPEGEAFTTAVSQLLN
ncbi:glycosyltransferase [Roseivirga sp. BDSF3-8]|uniref:glycosyltransferase n=1 Tax=Roseivirga sp. BDSF3-8 TaxID=3241598 RepID=UPI0035324049